MTLARQTEISRAVWDAYGDNRRKAELSHWRGYGKWKSDRRWIGIGHHSLNRIRRLGRDLRLRTLWDDKRAVLEWGPGGGSNAFAFRDVASAYYGVDISQQNLAEASRVMTEAGSVAFRPILIEDEPSVALKHIDGLVDIFLSTAVFQHFPSREYGAEVLNVIARACRRGAIGFIQIRYADDAGRHVGIADLGEYEKRFIKATCYPIDLFWEMCVAAGLSVVSVVGLDPSNNYVTFQLLRR